MSNFPVGRSQDLQMVDNITSSLDDTKRVSEDSLSNSFKHNHINPGSWVETLPDNFQFNEFCQSSSTTGNDQQQQPTFYIGDDYFTPTTIQSEMIAERRAEVLRNGRKRASSSMRTVDSGLNTFTDPDGDNTSDGDDLMTAKQRRPSQEDDDPIIRACIANVKTEQGTQAELALKLVQPPNTNQRPSYYSEGSRGPMKGADSKTVELQVDMKLKNMFTPGQACLVLLGTVAKHTTEVMEPHQFFKASVVGDTNDCKEISVDGFYHVAVKKMLTSSELSHNIKIESIGIKRIKTEGRTIKLERRCRVMYRVYLLQQCPYNKSWAVIGTQNVTTDVLTCEQPMGAPSISTLTQEESPFEGGATCAAKGKNLKGRGSTKMTFKSQDGSWAQDAMLYDNVTTRESVAFNIPPLPSLFFTSGVKEVRVTITPCVDGREGEPKDFRYRASERQISIQQTQQQQLSWNQAPINAIPPHQLKGQQHQVLPDICDVDVLLNASENSWGSNLNNCYGGSHSQQFYPLETQDIKPLLKDLPMMAGHTQQHQVQTWQSAGAMNNEGYIDQRTPPPQSMDGLDNYMNLGCD